MKSQQPSLLALLALLLCTLHHTAGSSRSSSPSPSEVRGRGNVGVMLQNWLRQNNITSNYGNHSPESRPPSSPPKPEGATGHVNRFSFNNSRGNVTTVISERSGGGPGWSPEEGVSSHCAYQVVEGGVGGQLCFRDTLLGYKCRKADCRTVVTLGNLVANILINGSVLLQWGHEGEPLITEGGVKTEEAAAGRKSSGGPGTNSTKEGSLPSSTVFSGRRHRRGGYELSCWWNGSYTQFECAGVHLGSSCRDFLLTELHENMPYRICLRSLAHSDPAQSTDQRDCVEFTLPPSGMQDIVIAMTTVGGAICVMLVIICLLVAYITENIMSPTTQHTYSYRTHSHH
ncbi:fibronectin type III domain-containing protein 10 [Platichthys flesus]|uniref:fibronectin type III domain-containing protein 10 n=1 Tax=Platichthys flesus TaxID=8260 RepID=UPI002DBAF5BB|nr:fibronectin type III domain-containing protein 10 [Platichthys flesus]XP_062257671.1 fibronectin type III domain-containing protein 10 [Platichthys flesus]